MIDKSKNPIAMVMKWHSMFKSMRIYRLLAKPMFVGSLIILLIILILAVFSPVFAPYEFAEQIPGKRLLPPSSEHWFGTDQYGRDVMSRIIYGTRISVTVALVTVAIGGVIGIIAGLVSGYFGGIIDTIVMRISDTLLTYPPIILAIAVIVVLGPGTMNVAYALALVNIPVFARLTRSRVLIERERDHVLNARSIGCTNSRILGLHILPHVYGTILVQISIAMGYAVISEAGLSFLGLGARPPAPSWGVMVSDSRAYMREAWWLVFYPGAAIVILVYSINIVSDVLRGLFELEE